MTPDEFARAAYPLLHEGIVLLRAHAGEGPAIERFVATVEKVRAQYRAAKEAPATASDVYTGPVTAGMRFGYKDSVFIPDGRRGSKGEFLDAQGDGLSEPNLRGMYRPIPPPAPEPTAPPAGVPVCHPACGRAAEFAPECPPGCFGRNGRHWCSPACKANGSPLNPPPSYLVPVSTGGVPDDEIPTAEEGAETCKRLGIDVPAWAADVRARVAAVATGGVRCFSCGASPREQLTAVAGRWYCSANCRNIDTARSVPPGPVPQEAIDREVAECRAMERKFPVSRPDSTAIVVALSDKVAALEADLTAARAALIREGMEGDAARAEVEQLRGKLAEAEGRNDWWKDRHAESTVRWRGMREATADQATARGYHELARAIRALPLDTGTATDTSGEAQADAIKAAVAAANNRAADAFAVFCRVDAKSTPLGRMYTWEFEEWLRSGEDAPVAVK